MKAGKNSIAKITAVGSSLTLQNLLFVSFVFVCLHVIPESPSQCAQGSNGHVAGLA